MNIPTQKRQTGFSMFELVVYLLMASILFSVMLNRYRDMPGEAERANVIAVLAQLKTGVNLQMMHAIATGNWQASGALDGSNPMDLMLETPGNYAGVYDDPDPANIPPRTWYFNQSAGELVYLVENTGNLAVANTADGNPANMLRFRIKSVYEEGQAENTSHWQGLVLEPVVDYVWRVIPLEVAMAAPEAEAAAQM